MSGLHVVPRQTSSGAARRGVAGLPYTESDDDARSPSAITQLADVRVLVGTVAIYSDHSITAPIEWALLGECTMSFKLPTRGLVFWPVANGDSTTVVIDSRTHLQVDLNHLEKSEGR